MSSSNRAAPVAPSLIRSIPGLALKRLLWSLVRRREFDYETITPQGWQIAGNTRDWIQRNLYYFGLWEPNLSAWIRGRLAPADVFVDVGANIGYFTLLAAERVGGSGKVVAIEAMPAIFDHLARHVRLNHLQNVRLINEAAVGPDAPKEVTLFWGDASNIGSTGMVKRSGQGQVNVSARTLRDMLTDEECRRARLIKVDVEGVEADVVRGLELGSGRFNREVELIVEVSQDGEQATAQDWLMKHFLDLGFFPYVLEEDHRFHSYAYPERSPLLPRRLTQPLTRMHNVVFSRVDADYLA